MNLMTFVRLSVLGVIAWTAIALGAGALGVGVPAPAEPTFFLPRPSLQDILALRPSEFSGTGQFGLVDQSTGRVKPVSGDQLEGWSLLSVSPWRDGNDKLEAVGRWIRRMDGEDRCCGIGCLTLPDSKVKRRIALDVLPAGRPYWINGRPGVILFPAADGRLYWCDIGGRTERDASAPSQRVHSENEENAVEARTVTWETAAPGTGQVYIADPAGSPDPRFRRLVIISMGVQEIRNGRRVNLASKLWWVVLNEEGDAIVNAGPLPGFDREGPENDEIYERMPQVAIGAGGETSLVYLRRRTEDRYWQLRCTKLDIDVQSGLPKTARGTASTVLADDIAPSAVVVSANGGSVYAVDRNDRMVMPAIPR